MFLQNTIMRKQTLPAWPRPWSAKDRPQSKANFSQYTVFLSEISSQLPNICNSLVIDATPTMKHSNFLHPPLSITFTTYSYVE